MSDNIIEYATKYQSERLDNGVNLGDIAKGMNLTEGVGEDWSEVTSGTTRNRLDNFNRYYKIFPSEEMGTLISYVFIVRPDLNMAAAAATTPYFYDIMCRYPEIYTALTYADAEEINVKSLNHHFIPFLVDRVQNYQIPDINLKSYEFEQPFTGFKTSYAGNTNESRSGSTFDISFRDTQALSITRLFDTWVRYIDLVGMGIVPPKNKYITSRILTGVATIDYATSIYLIRTKADGSEIVYFHKSVGGFPTNVPHSNWSFSREGATDNNINIQFSGAFPEPLDSRLLVDFNYNSGVLQHGNPEKLEIMIPTQAEYRAASYVNPIVGVPFITVDTTNSSRPKYRLRWMDADQ